MTPSYTFTLKPEKQASFSRIELLVVVLHLITFIILAVTRFPHNIGMLIFGILTAIIYLLLFFTSKNKVARFTLMEIPVYLFAFWWLLAQVYWMAALVFIFGTFATIAKRKVQLIFSAGQIVYNAFPKKVFNWADLNNVILKDGLLTIDFKNNKFMQQLIEEDIADEAAFNSFCRANLSSLNS